jgi:pimeloyl-ACP methyl ester carboxylesterase
MARVAALVGGGVRVLVVHRRGYGASRGLAPADDLATHLRDIVGILDARDIGCVTAVGVSGGATLVTALALEHPDRVASAVAHEPAIGPLAPGVHALLRRLGRVVDESPDPGAAASRVAATLAGPDTWARTGRRLRAAVAADAAATCRDVPLFREFAPSAGDLRRLRDLPFATSRGARSPAARLRVLSVLSDLAWASAHTIPGSGHLAHLDNPAALTALVRSRLPLDTEDPDVRTG